MYKVLDEPPVPTLTNCKSRTWLYKPVILERDRQRDRGRHRHRDTEKNNGTLQNNVTKRQKIFHCDLAFYPSKESKVHEVQLPESIAEPETYS